MHFKIEKRFRKTSKEKWTDKSVNVSRLNGIKVFLSFVEALF